MVHCDVQHPETFGITYVLGGNGTANYSTFNSTSEHMDLMRKHATDIGYTIQDITMQSGTTMSRLYASYLSCFRLTEVDILEGMAQVRAAAADDDNDDDDDASSFLKPGTICSPS